MNAFTSAALARADVLRICKRIARDETLDPVTTTSLQLALAMLVGARDELREDNRKDNAK